FEDCLHRLAYVLVEKRSHGIARLRFEMCPSVRTDVRLSTRGLEAFTKRGQLVCLGGIEHDEHWNVPAGFAVIGEVKLFTKATLTGSSDGYSQFDLVRELDTVGLADAVNLPPLCRIASSLHWAFSRTRGRATESRSNDRLEQVSRLLRRAVVNVEEPLPPEQKRGKRRRVELPVLKKRPRPNLIHCRQRLVFEDAVVLQSPRVHVRQAREVRLRCWLQL